MHFVKVETSSPLLQVGCCGSDCHQGIQSRLCTSKLVFRAAVLDLIQQCFLLSLFFQKSPNEIFGFMMCVAFMMRLCGADRWTL